MKTRIKLFSVLTIILLITLNCDKDSESHQFLCCSGESLAEENVDNLDQSPGIVESVSVFTPNGDGINDFYRIENIDLYPINTVTITDLNNNVVFQKERYVNITSFAIDDLPSKAFVGLHYETRRSLGAGTYKYKIVIENEQTFVQNGYLCLIREPDHASGTDFSDCNYGYPDPILFWDK